ncbi:hypothetical protein HY642_04815 [Candidatus Woesearchaeota archaeon]|nr:hypothetical protein [Candidatus Woesearchaeota archaeon]
MISIERQQRILLNLAQELRAPVTAFAVGGTAMMFLGLKESTLDIDMVFKDAKHRDLFKRAAEKLGYRKMDALKIYGAKNNMPEMLTLGDERFDLFVMDVVDFIFSEAMQQRAQDTHQFGDKLILRIANPHDIILMKCATDRLKDKDDARQIILNTAINWNIIIEEAKNHVRLGRHDAVFCLGEFLEDLKKTLKERIPDEVMETLWTLVQRQAAEKARTAKPKNK